MKAEFLKVIIISKSGDPEKDDVLETFLLKKEILLPFVPFPGLSLKMRSDSHEFDEDVESVNWDCTFQKMVLKLVCLDTKVSGKDEILEAYKEAGWTECSDEEEEEEDEGPISLDDNLS